MREDSDCSLYLAAVCAAVMSWIALSASCVREQPHPSRAPPRGPSSPAGSGQAWPWVRAYRNLRRWVESVPVPGVQRPLPPAPLPLCVTGRRREPTAGRQERSVCVRSCLRGAPGGGDRWEQWSPSLDPSIKGGGKCPLSTSLAHLPGAHSSPVGVTAPQSLRYQDGNRMATSRRRKPVFRLCTHLALLPCSVRPPWHTGHRGWARNPFCKTARQMLEMFLGCLHEPEHGCLQGYLTTLPWAFPLSLNGAQATLLVIQITRG